MFIVVQKRNHARFFNEDAKHPEKKLTPGTAVDDPKVLALEARPRVRVLLRGVGVDAAQRRRHGAADGRRRAVREDKQITMMLDVTGAKEANKANGSARDAP